MSCVYDDYDRLTGVKYDGESSDRYAYEYGANGQACVVRDNNLGRVLQTEHDLADRPMGTQLRDTSGNLLHRTELDYDKQNRLVGFGEETATETHKTGYTYDNDNRVTAMTFDGTAAVSYAYDELGRISTRTVGKLTSTYGYVSGGYGANSTTPLVASIAQGSIPFTYAYDNRGNIISETRSGVTTTYSYDALGQLIRVNDPVQNQTWVLNYDRGGNITSRVRYAYTTGTVGTALETIPYTYGDSNWKDKLTAYNGKAITYDAIGNPLTFNGWTYQWQAGRQLKRMSAEGTALTFKYDHNGLRTQKVVEASWYPETTNYYLHGKLLTHMTVDYTDFDEVAHTDKLHFFYDAQSRPAQVNFNGVLYTYIHNLQGDIVGLLDSTGVLVVEYKYDAWGKPISTTGNLADTLGKRNPFRYRGYVYDEETGLYYLRSRYYNPTVGRFVNADSLCSGMGLLSINVYSYCRNNPITKCDHDGHIDRNAIRMYASKYAKCGWALGTYWGGRNKAYYNYRADCANFASQCLHAGGLKMNASWHSYKSTKTVLGIFKKKTFQVSEAWRLARKQYEYFSNPDNGYINGEVLKFKSSDIEYHAKNSGIQTGDLLYFAGADGDNPHHATIVTKVEDGDIFYAGHTNERFDCSLTSIDSDEWLFVVRLFDDVE